MATNRARVEHSHTELLRQADERFAELAGFPQDWDSNGAQPITPISIASARRLLVLVCDKYGVLPTQQIRPFAIGPLPDGGVVIEWRRAEHTLAVLITADATLDYVVSEGAGAARRFGEAESVPEETILGLVARVVNLPATA
jgi:hypothetical protein